MHKIDMSRIWIVAALLACAEIAAANPVRSDKDQEFTMRIVHTNDMHARFEETSRLSSACSEKDCKEGKCYGGFARIATLVREAKKSETPTLFLNAGDTYQGTVWYNIFKWRIVAQFLNLLAPDAISLGNHEFDDGVDGLVPFIENASFPVLTCNLDLSLEPKLAATKLENSTVLLVDGVKVGVIGYLTPETKILSNTEDVIFKDEVDCIREEAKSLKKQGVNILIALGHSGYDVDKRIAKEVEDIDLVIGGHTNTFLYRGQQPDIEVPEGFYPTAVVQESGRKVYVVQAYAYTKYLGNFSVTFDVDGEVTRIVGNPILVDSSVQQAPDILEALEDLRPAIENVTHMVVGSTRVLLNGDSKNCRRQECNIGNLISDAIIDYNVGETVNKNGWTDAAIAVQNSGSIRTSITRDNDGRVTMGDVLAVLPFGNVIVKVTMTGKHIMSMLEWSVHQLSPNSTANLFGAFLQFSGVQVVYDLHQPAGSRVVSVKVKCASCRVPVFEDLNKNATYKVLMNDFMQVGGDGYEMLKGLEHTPLTITTADAVVRYMAKRSPVYPAVEWRITYVEYDSSEHIIVPEQDNNGAAMQRSFLFMTMAVVISVLLT